MTSSTQVQDWAFAEHAEDERIIRRAWMRFIATSLGAAVLLAGLAYLAAVRIADAASLDDARARAAVAAGVVSVGLEGSADRPQAAAESTVEEVMRRQSIRHLVVWESDGRVSWSDLPGLVGRAFRMEPQLQALFGDSGSLLGRPLDVDLEGADPPPEVRSTVEVFTATTAPDGRPLVVESYVERASLDDHRGETMSVLLPYVVAALLLVEVTCLLLGVLLVRQVRRGRQGRIRITTTAIETMEKDRRELAHQLHDGILQDLAATRYALASIAGSLPDGQAGEPREKLEVIQQVLHDELVDLRGLLGHLVPPDLESRSLDQAVRALVRHLVPPEVRCHLTLDLPVLTPDEGRVVYRVVREGLVNVVRHAGASEVRVDVRSRSESGQEELSVVVEDDGRGLAAGGRPDEQTLHFGLGLLAALVHDHRGELALVPRPNGPGTRLLVSIPLRSLAEV